MLGQLIGILGPNGPEVRTPIALFREVRPETRQVVTGTASDQRDRKDLSTTTGRHSFQRAARQVISSKSHVSLVPTPKVAGESRSDLSGTPMTLDETTRTRHLAI
jgi:hypothetical protein